MAEEFDIMKPISTDLDIGKTMFDEPDVLEQLSDAAAAEPVVFEPPEDNGVYNAAFGYLTAEEADFVAEISEEPEIESAATDIKGPVSADEPDTPLERALAELDELIEEKRAENGTSPTYTTPAIPSHTDEDSMFKVQINGRQASDRSKVLVFIVVCVVVITIGSISMTLAAINSFM